MRAADKRKRQEEYDQWLNQQLYDDPRRSSLFERLSPLIEDE